LAIGDALRVHQWGYVQQLEAMCDSLSEPYELGYLDGEGGDTAVSELSFESALRAAGGVTLAIDQVLAGKHQNGFCAVRPPGHHAGPRGAVAPEHHLECKSHGFCLLNSVAIGAAYALNVHRATVKRVAILDFDVHHGNGTQSIIEATIPSTQRETREMLGTTISIKVPQCSPWLDPKSDSTAIFFSSVNGYGSSTQGGTFYPGSGATNDSRKVEQDGEHWSEFAFDSVEKQPKKSAPHIFNIGMKGSQNRKGWRSAWRDHILPAVVAHQPDLIVVSAGFDAHRRDGINTGFIGLEAADYCWLTRQIVKVANKCCNGRVVSALEGGYRVQGGPLSPFARSVAAHVAELASPTRSEWSDEMAAAEREHEARLLTLKRRMHHRVVPPVAPSDTAGEETEAVEPPDSQDNTKRQRVE